MYPGNQRYGYVPMPSAPSTYPCIVCNAHSDAINQFPCGCRLPIHPQCVPVFLRRGGVCGACHQVWVPMDLDTATVSTSTRSQREWILSQAPNTQTRVSCGVCKTNYFYCICFLLLLLAVIIVGYVLYKVL